MSMIFPFANVSFLVFSIIYQISGMFENLIEQSETLSLLNCAITVGWTACVAKLKSLGNTPDADQKTLRIDQLWLIDLDMGLHRAKEQDLQFVEKNQVLKIIAFYVLRNESFCCMFDDANYLDAIKKEILTKVKDTRQCKLLSCITEDEVDLTEIIRQYMGPNDDFHKNITLTNFDSSLIIDSKGNYISEDDVGAHVVSMSHNYEVDERHINMFSILDICNISTK